MATVEWHDPKALLWENKVLNVLTWRSFPCPDCLFLKSVERYADTSFRVLTRMVDYGIRQPIWTISIWILPQKKALKQASLKSQIPAISLLHWPQLAPSQKLDHHPLTNYKALNNVTPPYLAHLIQNSPGSTCFPCLTANLFILLKKKEEGREESAGKRRSAGINVITVMIQHLGPRDKSYLISAGWP